MTSIALGERDKVVLWDKSGTKIMCIVEHTGDAYSFKIPIETVETPKVVAKPEGLLEKINKLKKEVETNAKNQESNLGRV